MRIILTVNYSPWSLYSGGGQRSTHNLAMKLAERGHDVHVVYSKSPVERVAVPDHLPYQIHWAALFSYKSSRKNLLRPLTSVSVYRTVEKLCRNSDKPLIVHANGEEAASIHKLRKRYNFGFIATPRYSGYPEMLLSGNPLTWREKLSLRLFNTKYIHQLNVLKKADRICPPSRWAARNTEKLYPYSRSKITVIPNGVPREFLSIKRSSEIRQTILFFGRLSPDKGADLLLRAYKLLKDPKPELLIAGKGEEKENLIRLGKKLGIHSQICYLPWLSHEELAGRLAEAKLCVLPSRKENYSLALLSALCVGVPTVSTKVGGTPELITDGVNGLLAEAGDPVSLADTMNRLLSDPGLAARLGRNARYDVRNSKTWDITCEMLEKVYQSVLENLDTAKGQT